MESERVAKKQRITPGMVILIGLIVVGLIFVLLPVIFRASKKARLTTGVDHGKQMGQAMLRFEADYGVFPDDSTAEIFERDDQTTQFRSEFSNAYARQLIAAGVLDDEVIGYLKVDDEFFHKPDGLVLGNEAFAPGEYGFIHVWKKQGSLSANSNEAAPLLISADYVEGRVIVVRLNGAVEAPGRGDGVFQKLWLSGINAEDYQLRYPSVFDGDSVVEADFMPSLRISKPQGQRGRR